MTPGNTDLWFLPLGGTGEIGMNMNLYGHAGEWLMVDCGVTFEKAQFDPETGKRIKRPDVQMADPAFITKQQDKLCGLVITHAHEDHVGAVPYLWPQLKCPIYTTQFTAMVLRRKLAEFNLTDEVPIHIIDPDEPQRIGPFDLKWVPLTHSIPEPYALHITTPVGSIFHTADWKLDPRPVIGEPYRPEVYQAVGKTGITAMVCDSTNATEVGHSLSEGELFSGLADHVSAAPGRVLIACFGSNVARLQTIARIADATGRYFGVIGRSMKNMSDCAKACSVVDENFRPIDERHLGFLPRHEVLGVATGSQGESRAALRRLATGRHPAMELEAGDTVIFSSKVIPGNEQDVKLLIELLESMNVAVITDVTSAKPIHASGHPASQELAKMYDWIQPQHAIPVHGEHRHMLANAAIAKNNGVPKQTVGKNGDLFFIAPYPGIRRGAAKTNRLGWHHEQLVPMSEFHDATGS